MSDRVAVMNLGRVEQVGPPARGLPAAGHALRGRLRRRLQPLPRARSARRSPTAATARRGRLGTLVVAQASPGLATGADVVAIVRPEGVRPAAAARSPSTAASPTCIPGPPVHLTLGARSASWRASPRATRDRRAATRFGWEPATSGSCRRRRRGAGVTFALAGRCAATGDLGAVAATADLAVGARVPHVARLGAS